MLLDDRRARIVQRATSRIGRPRKSMRAIELWRSE
jgi:hypothetical protein